MKTAKQILRKINRIKENNAILQAISDFLEANPDQRFNQALVNLDIAYSVEDLRGDRYNHVDYNEEPEITSVRVAKRVKFYKEIQW